jgi:hypothetical protein
MNTKKEPYSIGKEQFFDMLKPLSIRIIKRRINEIIFDRRKDFKENQNKTEKQIKSAKLIERSEYIEYFETYGYPDDFNKEN